MADAPGEKECCQRSRARWRKQIKTYYTAFPVIKNVKCDVCTNILQIRYYEPPGDVDDSPPTPEQ